MKHSPYARILLSMLGMAFLLYSVGAPLLGIIGERDTALITSIRRQGGERNETVRGEIYIFYRVHFHSSKRKGNIRHLDFYRKCNLCKS